MVGCWCKPVLPYAKRPSALLACSTAGLWEGDIFRGSPSACTTSQLSMSSFDASSDHLQITNIWIGESELNFPEAYGEELEMLGPLKVGARISILVFLFRDRYRDPGRLGRLQSRLMPTNALWNRGRNKQVDALQSNQLWLVSVASVPK